MKKWNLTGRKFMSVLLAVAMLAVMIPTALVEVANASDYTEQNGEYYFWTEQGLRDLLAAQEGKGDFNAHFAKSGSDLSEGDSLTITEDLTIYDKAGIHFGHATVSVAAGKTLTLEGRIEMDSWNSIKGSGTFVNQGAYLKVQDVTSANFDKVLAEAAALTGEKDDHGDRQSLHLKDRVNKTGNFIVPDGIELVVDGYLKVSGTLTVSAGAVVVNCGGVECEGLVIDQGGVFNNLNSWSSPVNRDGATAGVYFGDTLTVNGELYNNGVMNNGWRSGTSTITVGATGTLFNWDTLGGSQSVNLIVDANAHVENYGEMAVSFEYRSTEKQETGANIHYDCYNEGTQEYGYINCVKTVTDGAEDDTAALQEAIDALNMGNVNKQSYERFSVYVRNAEEDEALSFTLTKNLTIGKAAGTGSVGVGTTTGSVGVGTTTGGSAPAVIEGNNVDFLIVKQFGFLDTPGFAPAFTVAEGKTLTVNSVLFATAPVVVEGTLDNNSYCRIANGFTVNGTVNNNGRMDLYGLTVGKDGQLNNNGEIGTYEEPVILNGTLINRGKMDVNAEMTVSSTATVNVSQGEMNIRGCLNLSESATVIGGGDKQDELHVNYTRVVYKVNELAGAFADQLTDTVALDILNESFELSADVYVPAGKELHIWGDGNATFTVAEGATLTFADTEDGQRESRLECGVPLIVNGVLYAGSRAEINLERGITGSGTVTNNGNFHINDGEPCEVNLTGDGQLWWKRNVDVTPNDNAAAKLNEAMKDLDENRLYDVFLNGNWDADWKDGAVELKGNVTVPENVHFGVWDNPFYDICVAAGKTLTVDGRFSTNRSALIIGGTMVVNGNVNADCERVMVGGCLTVNKDGYMWCREIEDQMPPFNGPHGTIVNNGELRADEWYLEDESVLTFDDGGDDGWFRVYKYDELQAALSEQKKVRFEAAAMTISDTLTVPKDVNLDICADTLTIAAGGKLEVKGNVNSHGKDQEQALYLYGKIDTSYESGYFNGQGTVEEGSWTNIIPCVRGEGEDSWKEYRFTWRKVIQKSGNATLTLQELNAAWNGNMVTGVGVDLAKNTVLTLDVGDALTTTYDGDYKQIHFWGDDSSTVIIPTGTAWTDCAGFHSDAKVTVFGTLTLKEYANFNSDLLINGTVNAYDNMEMHNNLRINNDGKLNLLAVWHENENNPDDRWVERTGCVEFRDRYEWNEKTQKETLAETYWVQLPEDETDWDDYITFEDGARIDVIEDVDYTNAEELQAAMDTFSDRSHKIYLHNKTNDGFLNVNAKESLTIPGNITLCVNSWDGFTGICVSGADSRDDWGVLTVNGQLESNVFTVVNGVMTVNGHASINNRVQVGGDLTIAEGGDMWCRELTNKGEIWDGESKIADITGTITNNGWLHCNNVEPGTVIGGSGITKWERSFSTVSTMEELKAALNAAAVTDEEREICIAMNDAQRQSYDPEQGVVRFVINKSIIIPANVRLVMDDQSGFNGATVAPNMTVSVNGRIDFRGQGDWLDVEGTLINDYAVDEDDNQLYRGEINAKGICVKPGGVLTNLGHLEAYDYVAVEEGGQLLNHDFIRAFGVDVQGLLENNSTIELRGNTDQEGQWHPGSISVGGTMVNNSNLDNLGVTVRWSGQLTNNGFMNLKYLTNNGNIINNEGHAIRFETYDDGNGTGTVTGDGWFGWWCVVNTVDEAQEALERKGRGSVQWDLLTDLKLTEDLTIPEDIELVIGKGENFSSSAAAGEGAGSPPYARIQQGVTITNNGSLIFAMPETMVFGLLLNNGHVETHYHFTVGGSGSLTNNGEVYVFDQFDVWGELLQGNGGWLFATKVSDRDVAGCIDLSNVKLFENHGYIGCYSAGGAGIVGLPEGYYLTEQTVDGYRCVVMEGEGPTEPQELLPGDVNGDSVVDDDDLTALLRHVAKIELLDEQYLGAADFNGDGRVDADDLTDMVNWLDRERPAPSGGGSAVVETGQTG